MQPQNKLLTSAIATTLLLTACSRSTTERSGEQPQDSPRAEAKESPAAPSNAPAPYKVRFTTSEGPFVVEVHPDWAPIGAERFQQLIEARYFDGARFFRVVPGFVVQFGLASTPAVTKKWDKAIKDDPVVRTNRPGSLSFATMGRNTRTTQIFINLRSNQNLDEQGFAPFAQVVEGMEVVQRLHSGYGERPDQEAITKQGNSYLLKAFPNLDYIQTVRIL